MQISLVGVDFRTASVEVRERVSLGAREVLQLLGAIRNDGAFEGAVILSTCNRTEMYFVERDSADQSGQPKRTGAVLELLTRVSAIKPAAAGTDPSLFHRRDGLAAVRHLFRVAASLDSQIVGERQIMGQVKDAYSLACEARTARFLLHKLMHRAFGVSKRVRTETRLTRGTASVAQAAADLAEDLLGGLSGKTVMLIGAGPTAESAAQAAIRAGAASVIVANRTLSKARRLAQDLAAPVVGDCHFPRLRFSN